MSLPELKPGSIIELKNFTAEYGDKKNSLSVSYSANNKKRKGARRFVMILLGIADLDSKFSPEKVLHALGWHYHDDLEKSLKQITKADDLEEARNRAHALLAQLNPPPKAEDRNEDC
jgi:hypothetical protein